MQMQVLVYKLNALPHIAVSAHWLRNLPLTLTVQLKGLLACKANRNVVWGVRTLIMQYKNYTTFLLRHLRCAIHIPYAAAEVISKHLQQATWHSLNPFCCFAGTALMCHAY